MDKEQQFSAVQIGIVGLGLMGTSIIVSLLVAGHKVMALAPIKDDLQDAERRINEQLKHCCELGLAHKGTEVYTNNLDVTMDYGSLSECSLVLECVVEDVEIKSSVYKKIAAVVDRECIIASNTSAIPISLLQDLVPHPERFIGIHWAEPAYATRFMEITCGKKTDTTYTEWVFDIAHHWGKEPTLLRKDIKGFIANRLMYAVYREMFHLIETGHTTMEDADKAFRYDAGSWMTLMGIFTRMDYIGLADYSEMFRSVFPRLNNATHVPSIMQEMVRRNAKGIQNVTGLYSYTPDEAKEWEEAFAKFNRDIYQLAANYPSEKPTLNPEHLS